MGANELPAEAQDLKVKADQAFRGQDPSDFIRFYSSCELLKVEDFTAAVALYTQALMWCQDERLLSNRSAAHVAQGNFKAALEDAKKCALLLRALGFRVVA